MEQFIDLHTHSIYSDGFLTPRKLLEKAHDYELSAISITDHDTTEAYTPQTLDFANEVRVELVPGIEFSTKDDKGHKYHILGLLIDLENKSFNGFTKLLKQKRISETKDICNLLQKNGWVIDFDILLKEPGTLTKSHVARAVIRRKDNLHKLYREFGNNFPTEGQFVEATMVLGKPAYVDSVYITPEQAIKCIYDAKGLSFLAHPTHNIIMGESFEELCTKFLGWGIDGFEAINVQYDKSNNDVEVDYVGEFINFAHKNNIVISGGSDFHHDNKNLIGNFIDMGFKNHRQKVTYNVLEKLKDYHLQKYK